MKTLLTTLAGLLLLSAAAYAQSNPWDTFEQNGAKYAGTRDDRKNAVIFVCPVTGAPKLIVQSEQFRVSVPNGHRYTLAFITDRGRSEVMAVAEDAELTYAATDLNKQVSLERLMEDIGASQSFQVYMSPFGWKGQFTSEGAAAALKPLLDGC